MPLNSDPNYQGQYNQQFQLPASAQSLFGPDFGQQFLGSLDQTMKAQEGKQMEDLLGFQESRGLLQSGDTNRQLVEQVLGPSLARRTQALMPFAEQGAQAGYNTRMEQTQFQQQQQFAQEQFQRQIQSMQEQARLNAELVQLQASLMPRSSGNDFFHQALGSGLGAGLGSLIGGGTRGFGGFAATKGLDALFSAFDSGDGNVSGAPTLNDLQRVSLFQGNP